MTSRRTKQLTFAEVRTRLKENGMMIRKDTVGRGPTGSGELRVSYNSKAMWPENAPTLTKDYLEDTAYYTDDLDDALRTGLNMAWQRGYYMTWRQK